MYKKSKKHSLSVAIITDNDIFNGSLEFTGDVTQIKWDLDTRFGPDLVLFYSVRRWWVMHSYYRSAPYIHHLGLDCTPELTCSIDKPQGDERERGAICYPI